MKEIIIKYLDKQYLFTLDTFVNYTLYDKQIKERVGLKTALQQIIKIFGVTIEEVGEIFDEWADKKSIEMNNKIADLQYKIYQATGFQLELTSGDINRALEQEATDMEYRPYLPAENPQG